MLQAASETLLLSQFYNPLDPCPDMAPSSAASTGGEGGRFFSLCGCLVSLASHGLIRTTRREVPVVAAEEDGYGGSPLKTMGPKRSLHSLRGLTMSRVPSQPPPDGGSDFQDPSIRPRHGLCHMKANPSIDTKTTPRESLPKTASKTMTRP